MQNDSHTRSSLSEELAMHLAETTDLSPNQARETLQKHGNDLVRAKVEAATFKVES